MADPVAEKSGFLCMYMSGHPDTLVAYAKWFGKVKEQIAGAKMTGITTKVRGDGVSEDELLMWLVGYHAGVHVEGWVHQAGCCAHRAASKGLRRRQASTAGNESARTGRSRNGSSKVESRTRTS